MKPCHTGRKGHERPKRTISEFTLRSSAWRGNRHSARSYDGAEGSVLPTTAVKFGMLRQNLLIQGSPLELHAPRARGRPAELPPQRPRAIRAVHHIRRGGPSERAPEPDFRTIQRSLFLRHLGAAGPRPSSPTTPRSGVEVLGCRTKYELNQPGADPPTQFPEESHATRSTRRFEMNGPNCDMLSSGRHEFFVRARLVTWVRRR